MKRGLVTGVLAIVAATFALVMFSCRGNSSSPWFFAAGSVGLYTTGTGTDVISGGTGTDLNSGPTSTIVIGTGTDTLSLFSEATVTIVKVQVINTGSGAACDLLTEGTTTLNFANLGGNEQLVTQAACTADSFNRLHIEFDRRIELVSRDGAVGSQCSFVSYMEKNSRKPDVVVCPDDPESATCFMDINGAVNVLPNTGSKLTVYVKQLFVSNFGDPDQCLVTMKLSPLHAAGN